MISLEMVFFACGLALGVVLATFILVGTELYREWRCNDEFKTEGEKG